MRARLLAVLGLATMAVWAQPMPVIRVKLDPPAPIVGQAVRLYVDVLAPNYMTSAPAFPQIEIGNAIVVLSDERAENLNETINGIDYAGIRRAYLIYPQVPGEYNLPDAEIGFAYASDPPRTTQVRLPLPHGTFRARVPPGAENMDPFFPSTRVTLQQTLDRGSGPLRAGDTIRRTIVITADGTRSMLIPPLTVVAPDHLRIYKSDPSTEDLMTANGVFTGGRRVERFTYLIQKEGGYDLPEIRLEWWDTGAQKKRDAVLPALHFEAAPAPQEPPPLAPEPEPRTVPPPAPVPWYVAHRNALIAASAALILGLVLWLRPRLVFWTAQYRSWREKRAHSERAMFSHLAAAASSNDAARAYRALLNWLDVAQPGVALDDFIRRAQDPRLRLEVDAMSRQIYGNTTAPAWRGDALKNALSEARAHLLRERMEGRALPALNPWS